jgi:hypothetical protein
MAGAVWVIQSHIPAQIGSQTSSISGDVAVLKEQFGTIKADVSEIRKDIKDILIKALDATRQDAHEAAKGKSSKPGALNLGNRIFEMAQALKVKMDESVIAQYGAPIVKAAFSPTGQRPDVQHAADVILRYRSFIGYRNTPDLSAAKPYDGPSLDYKAATQMFLSRYQQGLEYLYFAMSGLGKASMTGPVAALGFFLDDPGLKPELNMPKIQMIGTVPPGQGATVEFLYPTDDPAKNRVRSSISAQYIIVHQIRNCPGRPSTGGHFQRANLSVLSYLSQIGVNRLQDATEAQLYCLARERIIKCGRVDSPVGAAGHL